MLPPTRRRTETETVTAAKTTSTPHLRTRRCHRRVRTSPSIRATPPTSRRPRGPTRVSPSQRPDPRDAGAGQHREGGHRLPPAAVHRRRGGTGHPGRRSRALGSTGRRIGATAGSTSGSLHLVETLRAAAGRHVVDTARPGVAGGRVTIEAADLRTAVREGREANLLLFCVDASGSMAARRRMTQVKTAILSLLTDAYRRRDKVAMISFRGSAAELTLPPTGSVDVAAALLDDLPAGGRTPLAEALLEASSVVRRERLRDARLRPLLLVVTDGRATWGPDAVGRSRLAAEHVAALGVPSVVVDCEEGPLRLGLAATLSGHLRAEHVPMARISATGLVDVVTGRVA
ncbi:VWA domain-containing protein [Nocardioides alcanivorans]|uniref:VWA domain-containing protein n=1 Tax=Nocardioides alcanivorans TaxID=2897352 RepID=UPI0035DED562